MGATSLTEAWDARRSSSHNHFMLGQIMEWFYHDLAGIASDPAGPGFRKIIIRPQPVGDVTWAKASYDSLHGKISVQWDRTDGRFTLKAAVPANTTATVFVPVGSGMTVTEGGRPAESRSRRGRFCVVKAAGRSMPFRRGDTSFTPDCDSQRITCRTTKMTTTKGETIMEEESRARSGLSWRCRNACRGSESRRDGVRPRREPSTA
jgi:hypothetical protein